ncbi:MAG: hypothetical protein ACM37W_25345 [Actinomycetota bacterium]
MAQQELWGLLISHPTEPKQLSAVQLQIIQMVIEQASVAVAQSRLLSSAHSQAYQEALMNEAIAWLQALN